MILAADFAASASLHGRSLRNRPFRLRSIACLGNTVYKVNHIANCLLLMRSRRQCREMLRHKLSLGAKITVMLVVH